MPSRWDVSLNRNFAYSLLVFLAGSSYGLIVPIIKSAHEAGFFPHSILPLQYMVAFLACVAVMFVRRMRASAPKQAIKLALLGVCTGSTSLCYYAAVALLPASAALTLLFQYIWVSVLIECVREKRLPMRSTVVAVVIVLIGTVLATGVLDGSVVALDPVGVMFGAASAIFYALYLYCSGIIATDQPTLVRTTALAFGGMLITSIASPSVYVTTLLDPAAWPYIVALAITGILLPTSLINFASPRLSTGMVSIMASSELPVGVIAAWAFMGDEPSALVLLGALLVLVGMIVKQVPVLLEKRRPFR